MPSKRRTILPNIHPIDTARLGQLRDLAAKAATDRHAVNAIQEANATLGKFERGYFVAWRDALRLLNSTRAA